MSKSNILEADFLKLYFQAIDAANIADNTVTSPAANVYVSLFVADPTESGLLTDEATYPGYARVPVPRSAGGWTLSGPDPTFVSPVSDIVFPICTGPSSEVYTHFGVSRTIGGAPDYIGTITPSIAIGPSVQPKLTTASFIAED